MSNTSIDRFGGLTPDHLRGFNNEYQLDLLASNSKRLVDYQRDALLLQGVTAITNLRAQANLAQSQANLAHLQGEANQTLNEIASNVNAMMRELHGLDSTMKQGFSAMQSALETVSRQLIQQQQTLESIAETLSRPYESKALELRKEADKWLKRGMESEGRDRTENWNDAMRLLKATTANPIGMQDYVAWFQIGWLQWKHEGDVAQAEQSFYRAARLSADSKDLYHIKSLRHLAYMFYLKSDYAQAYDTMIKALTIKSSYDNLYDAARYAAKAGFEETAIKFLDKCIDLRPTTIITMYSEVDFQ